MFLDLLLYINITLNNTRMKTIIANTFGLVFLFGFIFVIAIAAAAKFCLTLFGFGCIYVAWQGLKRIIIWADPSMKDELNNETV